MLPVVPMFHAMAWGLPYACVMAGANLVMPGPGMTPAALLDLLESERVTITAGVPTIWMGMLPLLDGRDLSVAAPGDLRRLGGAQGAVGGLAQGDRAADHPGLGHDRAVAAGHRVHAALGVRRRQRGRRRPTSGPPPASRRSGVEMRIVDAETREELPWDNEAVGELEARGPWIARQYYRTDEPGEQFSARRLAAHRRRRRDLRTRLPAAGRPDQGPDQVRRRVDLLGRPGEPDHGATPRWPRRR